jgi:hypothetical protein
MCSAFLNMAFTPTKLTPIVEVCEEAQYISSLETPVFLSFRSSSTISSLSLASSATSYTSFNEHGFDPPPDPISVVEEEIVDTLADQQAQIDALHSYINMKKQRSGIPCPH